MIWARLNATVFKIAQCTTQQHVSSVRSGWQDAEEDSVPAVIWELWKGPPEDKRGIHEILGYLHKIQEVEFCKSQN